MLQGLHHVGLLVDDLDDATAFYTGVLGGTVAETVTVGSGTTGADADTAGLVDVAFVDLPGYRVELIDRQERGTDLDGILDALAEQSDAHVALIVSELPAAIATVEDAGYPIYNDRPVDGLGSYRRAFVDPEAVPGMPVELVELLEK